MRIPYRVTSVIALAVLGLRILTDLFPSAPKNSVISPEPGVIRWDPCKIWVQYSPADRVAVLLLFGAFLVFMAKGLRNRPGPRWLAISGLIAVPMVVASDWWRISANCYGASGLVSTCLWIGAVTAMFLHHAFQSRAPGITDSLGPATRREQINRFVYRSAWPSFLIALLTWALLNQVRVLTYDGDNPKPIHAAITAVQQLVAWAAVALFIVTIAVGLHALISRLRTAGT